MQLRVNLVGRKFGRLTVVSLAGRDRKRSCVWECVCECGRSPKVPPTTHKLTSGNTRSCGCLSRETTGAMSRTHGLSKTPEYIAWCAMKQRTSDPKHVNYEHYRSRGISVCGEWAGSFEAFLSHVGRQPFKGATLDRIDNDRGYEPGNVRWATRKAQCRNKGNNVTLTHEGETLSLAEWSARTGLGQKMLSSRAARGLSAEACLRPLGKNRKAVCSEREAVHKIWHACMARCDDVANPNYGGRGIRVCERWRGPDGFEHFWSDMGPRPTRQHSLNRTDNDGPYSPENCRWATAKEQARNTRRNRMLSFAGRTRCLAEWAELQGLPPWLISQRLSRGMAVERALTKPRG